MGEGAVNSASSGTQYDIYSNEEEFAFEDGTPAPTTSDLPNVTPDPTPVRGDAELQTEVIGHTQESKRLQEEADQKKASADGQAATAVGFGTVGAGLGIAAGAASGTVIGLPLGVVLGVLAAVCALVSGILGMTSKGDYDKANELSKAAEQEKTTADLTQAELDMPEDAPDAVSTSSTEGTTTEAGANLANMASANTNPELTSATIEGQDAVLQAQDGAPAVETATGSPEQ